MKKSTEHAGSRLDGSITAGSRSPLVSTPVWATLEVVTGGFATGQLKAGGPLLEHELRLLASLGLAPTEDARAQLNAYFLTEEGIASLASQLQSGCYEISVPEEGALLAAAWLVNNGKAEQARELIAHIAPWFLHLRFYPVPTQQARQLGARVCLKPVEGVMKDLAEMGPNIPVLRQAESINTWTPLYDRAVSLFLETVTGELPQIAPDALGAWTDPVSRKFLTNGGWPCQQYPSDWQLRAQALLDDIAHARAAHTQWQERDWDSFAQIGHHLRQCCHDPQALTGRDVGRVRLLLARYISKRGAPGSASRTALRQDQAAQTRGASHLAISQLVSARLSNFPGDKGLDDLELVTRCVDHLETKQWAIAEGTAIPYAIKRKVARSRVDTIQVLVDENVIRSAEMLAIVLPQMSASISAMGIADRALQQLYGAIYQAFRRRRSLLLLNLEKQVQLDELPWVIALNALKDQSTLPTALARKTLEEVALLTLIAFPQTVVPNKLLQELRGLAKEAGITLPLVEELAVDIFMGAFSDKFTEAAQCAATLLGRTVYARYYGIDIELLSLAGTAIDPFRPGFPRKSLRQMCEALAGVRSGGHSTVVNGMLIEQQQILTTQNLAVLVTGLGIRADIQCVAEKLARQCFEWICNYMAMKRSGHHAKLIAVKNGAYAWRQMIFFLALEPAHVTDQFLLWATEHLKKQAPDFAARFKPALAGLELAAAGVSFDREGSGNAGARRFLAYSKEMHWL